MHQSMKMNLCQGVWNWLCYYQNTDHLRIVAAAYNETDTKTEYNHNQKTVKDILLNGKTSPIASGSTS